LGCRQGVHAVPAADFILEALVQGIQQDQPWPEGIGLQQVNAMRFIEPAFPEAIGTHQGQSSHKGQAIAVVHLDHNGLHGTDQLGQAGSGHGLHQAAAGGRVVVVVAGFFSQQHDKAECAQAQECGGEGGDVEAATNVDHLPEVASHGGP
jgi:hypothetical protein